MIAVQNICSAINNMHEGSIESGIWPVRRACVPHVRVDTYADFSQRAAHKGTIGRRLVLLYSANDYTRPPYGALPLIGLPSQHTCSRVTLLVVCEIVPLRPGLGGEAEATAREHAARRDATRDYNRLDELAKKEWLTGRLRAVAP